MVILIPVAEAAPPVPAQAQAQTAASPTATFKEPHRTTLHRPVTLSLSLSLSRFSFLGE